MRIASASSRSLHNGSDLAELSVVNCVLLRVRGDGAEIKKGNTGVSAREFIFIQSGINDERVGRES